MMCHYEYFENVLKWITLYLTGIYHFLSILKITKIRKGGGGGGQLVE